MVLQRRRRGGAVLSLLVVVGPGGAGAGAGQLADAVEVVALGAVFPLAAFRAVEIGVVDAGGFVAAVESRVFAVAGTIGRSVGRRLGARRALGRTLRRRCLLVGLEERILVEHLVDL